MGAKWKGRPRRRHQCHFGATKFLPPRRNLGGLGNSGLVSVNDSDALAERRRLSLRVCPHWRAAQYHHKHVGANFRMDPLQAALLAVEDCLLLAGYNWQAAPVRTRNVIIEGACLRFPASALNKAGRSRRREAPSPRQTSPAKASGTSSRCASAGGRARRVEGLPHRAQSLSYGHLPPADPRRAGVATRGRRPWSRISSPVSAPSFPSEVLEHSGFPGTRNRRSKTSSSPCSPSGCARRGPALRAATGNAGEHAARISPEPDDPALWVHHTNFVDMGFGCRARACA